MSDGAQRGRLGRFVRAFVAFVVFLVVGAVAYLSVTAIQVNMASSWDSRRPTDAIVVLGAAQYDGAPSPVLRARLDHAKRLFDDGVAPKIVLTGASKSGDRFTEAYVGMTYLLKQGVPEGNMLVVTTGSSTYESLAAAKRVIVPVGVETVVLVSDPSHNLRLSAIASELGLDASISPTSSRVTWGPLKREVAAVAAGRIFGFRRLDWVGSQ